VNRWHCPSCRRTVDRGDDIVRVWCATCRDTPTPMLHGSGKTFELYCGAYSCPSRIAGRLFVVKDDELVDGEVWLCPICRSVEEWIDVDTELV